MSRLKKWKDRPQASGLHDKSAASVIIVPGVSADALDKQTCYHFEELMKHWCAAPHVWIYDHGVQLHTPQSWGAFCDCGDDLLSELLILIQQQPQVEIVLIGHRLGAFILKKALLIAGRRKYQERYISLFDALRTLVMIGEPYLDSEDRTQWSSLVQDSLESTKGSMPDTFSVDALSCLKYIEEKFEHLEIDSQFFQVSGKPSKRKGLHRSRLKAKNCVCDGSATVRMWTTQDEDEAVLEGIETNNSCIFSQKSGWHQPLRLITAGEWGKERLSITGGNTPAELTATSSTGAKNAGKETVSCGPMHHAGATATAPSGGPVQPPTGVQATTTHTSAVSEGHASGGDHNTESNPTLIMEHHSSAKASITAPSSVYSGRDAIEKPNNPRSDSTDHQTLDIEDACQSTGACPISSQEMMSQSGQSEGLSTSTSSHETFVEVPNNARHRARRLPLRLSLPPACEVFFPREDATTWLENLLFPEASNRENKELRSAATTVGVLYGIGGVGKTQIALNFAQSAESRFDAVFWLRAESEESLLQSFHDSAIALRLVNGRRDYSHTQSAALCMKWLVESDMRWLLVFDNVHDAQTITPYIPHSKIGATIITSQNPRLSFPDAISPILYHVQPLSVNESRHFLLQSTHLEMEDVSSEAGLELLRDLSGLPLTLFQMANLIRIRGWSMAKFASMWKKNTKRPVNHDLSTALSDMLSSTLKTLSPDAREILVCLSYMSPDAAPTSVVQACFEKSIVQENPLTVENRLHEAIEQLTRFALIYSVGDAFYMHRLIQNSIQKHIKLDDKRHALRSLTSVLGAQWPSDRKIRNVLHGFWAGFDDIMNQNRHVVNLISTWQPVVALDEFVDESFPRVCLRYLWYDRRIRGNNTNYADMAYFAAAAIALPRQSLKDSSQSARSPSYMPRRLVHIDHQRQKWQLIDTRGRKLSYMALSLGFSDEEGGPKLTKSNLRTFQKGVALARMPKAFRDACCFSGMLLTEYLWIDAICIDQGNDEETVSEVRHMIDIYQHAIATISPCSGQEQRFRRGQVKWNRYEVLCGKTSISEQLHLLKTCLTETDSLDSLASTVDPQVFSNIVSYVQDSLTVSSDSEPLLVFHAPTALSGLNAQSLLEQSAESSNDHSLTRIEEPPPSDEQSEDTNRVTHAMATAWLRIDEGIGHYAQKNMLRAVTKLVQARELVRALRMSSQGAVLADLQAAMYLARIFLIDGSPEAAMDLLDNVEASKEKAESRESDFETIMAQFHIVKGDAYLMSGNIENASETYCKNIDAADGDEEGEIVDLATISKLRLSNCKMAQSDLKGAHILVKEVIAHFGEQDSKHGQAQYARALYHQALMYKEENKEKFRKRSIAAARQALEELCEEHDLAMPASDRELERDDFECVMELRFL